MPSLKSLRTLCDKMKNLSQTLTIVCSSKGDISFIVETDSAMVVSRYFNLILDHNDSQINVKNHTNGEHDEIMSQIDTKTLAMIFTGIQVAKRIFFCTKIE